MTIAQRDAINDARERLFDVGFTMQPGFSEHGPMVAEVISTLGFNDEVAPWVEFYKARRRHIPPPPPQAPLDGNDAAEWRGALGDAQRITDWLEFFRRDLEERPWREALSVWVPRLLDGYAGSLTHGLLRTAHAVRAMPEAEPPTALDLDELARGLASWAATYQRVAGNPDRHGDLALDEALRRLPRVFAPARPGAPDEAIAPGFIDAVEGLAAARDAGEAISRHTALVARVFVAHPEMRPIPLIQLVHAMTAPVAMRNLLPFVPAERAAWIYGCLWQVSASIIARVVPPSESEDETAPALPEPSLSRDDLAHRAVEQRDEHTIKLTEALLREDAIRPDPVYHVAIEAVLQRLPRWT